MRLIGTDRTHGAHALARHDRGATHPWVALAGWLAICQLAGIGAALGTDTDSAWFESLATPSWYPPAWIFAPVWTAIYALMGVAAWRVWRTRRRAAPLGIFLVQLALNVAWPFLFFTRHDISGALLDIACLWLAIVATTVAFWQVDRIAGTLMLPYLAWVTFATALNAAIASLN